VEREDLGALFARITTRLINAEKPLLAARHLSMWGYIVLSELARRAPGKQADLAKAIGYDKTRLIGLLDELERDRLITRSADPADRRVRNVVLTARGRKLHERARADIRSMEAEMLSDLRPAERKSLLEILPRLAVENSSKET
jgi:DNA-binding MarR family transcriptional regulator